MFADLVKSFTISCPECKTSITFSIDTDNLQELYNAVRDLKCPRCTNELSYEAQHMISAIRVYNNALKELHEASELNYSKLS